MQAHFLQLSHTVERPETISPAESRTQEISEEINDGKNAECMGQSRLNFINVICRNIMFKFYLANS